MARRDTVTCRGSLSAPPVVQSTVKGIYVKARNIRGNDSAIIEDILYQVH